MLSQYVVELQSPWTWPTWKLCSKETFLQHCISRWIQGHLKLTFPWAERLPANVLLEMLSGEETGECFLLSLCLATEKRLNMWCTDSWEVQAGEPLGHDAEYFTSFPHWQEETGFWKTKWPVQDHSDTTPYCLLQFSGSMAFGSHKLRLNIWFHHFRVMLPWVNFLKPL